MQNTQVAVKMQNYYLQRGIAQYKNAAIPLSSKGNFNRGIELWFCSRLSKFECLDLHRKQTIFFYFG